MNPQWAMDNYAGKITRNCNATALFAESVTESRKTAIAAKHVAIYTGIEIPFLPDCEEDDVENDEKDNLTFKSSQDYLQGVSFLHPKEEMTVQHLSQLLGCDCLSLISSCIQYINGDQGSAGVF